MLMRRTRPDEEIVNVRLAIPDEHGVNAGRHLLRDFVFDRPLLPISTCPACRGPAPTEFPSRLPAGHRPWSSLRHYAVKVLGPDPTQWARGLPSPDDWYSHDTTRSTGGLNLAL